METSMKRIMEDDDSKNQAAEPRAIRTMKQLSEEAKQNGTADITLDEINAEIEAVRAERRARKME